MQMCPEPEGVQQRDEELRLRCARGGSPHGDSRPGLARATHDLPTAYQGRTSAGSVRTCVAVGRKVGRQELAGRLVARTRQSSVRLSVEGVIDCASYSHIVERRHSRVQEEEVRRLNRRQMQLTGMAGGEIREYRVWQGRSNQSRRKVRPPLLDFTKLLAGGLASL